MSSVGSGSPLCQVIDPRLVSYLEHCAQVVHSATKIMITFISLSTVQNNPFTLGQMRDCPPLPPESVTSQQSAGLQSSSKPDQHSGSQNNLDLKIKQLDLHILQMTTLKGGLFYDRRHKNSVILDTFQYFCAKDIDMKINNAFLIFIIQFFVYLSLTFTCQKIFGILILLQTKVNLFCIISKVSLCIFFFMIQSP